MGNTLVKVGKWAGRWMYEIKAGISYRGNLSYFKCNRQWVIIKANGTLLRYSSFAEAKSDALKL